MEKFKKSKKLKVQSINRKLIVPISGLILLQCIIFVLAIFGAGVIRELTQNAYYNLYTTVNSAQNTLGEYMENKWSRYSNYQEMIRIAKEDYISYQEKNSKEPMNVSRNMADSMLKLLNNSNVTETFVIYDEPEQGEGKRSGFFLRDLEPEITMLDNSDLRLDYGSAEIANEMQITLGNYWRTHIPLEEQADNSKFYYDMKSVVAENPNLSTTDFGRWVMPFQFQPGSERNIAYCLPLLDDNHQMFGMIGIGITETYFQKLLPYDKLPDGSEITYVLAMEDENGIHGAVSKGEAFSQMIPDDTNIMLNTLCSERNPIYELKGSNGKKIIAAKSQFNLYHNNVPFEKERWMLLGMMWKDTLLFFVRNLGHALFFAFLCAMMLGVWGAVLISLRFSRPLRVMVQSLRQSDPEREILLPKLHISEIDELAEAVENLSADVAYSASRLSEIIRMMDLPMGTIDYDKDGSDVFCTLEVGVLLNFTEGNRWRTRLKRAEFDKEMERFHQAMVHVNQGDSKPEENLFREVRIQVNYPDSDFRWIQLKILENDEKYLALVQDVTEQVQEKMKLEWERNFDPMTNLYNRRSFRELVLQLLEQNEIKNGAMVMWDLDNLKYINDTYGHDFGDAYIIQAASVLSSLNLYGTIVSRMSGDEFLAFFYGFETQEEIRKTIYEIHEKLRSTELLLPGNQSMRVRASAGICWYPQDALGYDELVRFADFAMYSAKNLIKGEIQEFEMDAFQRDEVLFSGQEALNRFIEDKLLDFAFQPIVDAKTGEIFAYEALMRPSSESLKTVGDVMRLAKAQSKLYQIEVMTFQGVFQAFSRQKKAFGNAKLFLNSIPNTNLTEADYSYIEEKYKDELYRLVVEIIESDRSDRKTFAVKKRKAEAWGAQIALDDFGSGYNTESSLLYMSPDYIKLDMSIVHGVDKDVNRKNLMSSILSYTKPRNIITIAEGIETKEEMETVLELGVDLLQGFYVAMPNLEVKQIPEKIRNEIIEFHNKFNK